MMINVRLMYGNLASLRSLNFCGRRPIPRLPELASSCARPAAALRDDLPFFTARSKNSRGRSHRRTVCWSELPSKGPKASHGDSWSRRTWTYDHRRQFENQSFLTDFVTFLQHFNYYNTMTDASKTSAEKPPRE